jgi:hypothetical protein
MTPIFIASSSPIGNRRCVVESSNDAVWGYLVDIDTKEIVADVPVCSLSTPGSMHQLKERLSAGGAPPLVAEFATDGACIGDLTSQRLAVRWFSNGSGVVITLDDKPQAMMVIDDARGFSRATKRDGPWGRPWDDELFRTMEANQLPDPTSLSVTPAAGAAGAPSVAADH